MNEETTIQGSDSQETTTPAETISNSEVQAEREQSQEQTETTTEAGQSESESFFDPKTVPAELLPAYKQMQAAFTKKTQEIATFKKEFETLKTKAESYAKYEQYAPILEEMLSSADANTTKNTPEMAALEKELRDRGYSDEAIEMMKLGAQFTLNQFNQKQQTEKEQIALNAGINESEKVDSRLNDESLVYETSSGKMTFGDIVAQMVQSDPNWTKDPVAATKKAIQVVDALIGKAKTEGKEELSASARSKANKFPNTNSSPQKAVSTGQPLTMKEAAEQAKRELGI